MNQSQKSRRIAAKLVTVSINGVAVQVNPTSIDKSHRTVLHGDYKGQQVNSPAIHQIGDSIILWPNADKPFVAVMSKAEMGVLATKFLQADGFTVSPVTANLG